MPERPASPNVPYLAYKSKRHSRNLSNSNAHLVPNQSPPPISRPPTANGSLSGGLQPTRLFLDVDRDDVPPPSHNLDNEPSTSLALTFTQSRSEVDASDSSIPAPLASAPVIMDSSPSSSSSGKIALTTPAATEAPFPGGDSTPGTPVLERTNGKAPERRETPKKTSTYRRLPRKATPGDPSTTSPLRHTRTPSTTSSVALRPGTVLSEPKSSPSPTPTASPLPREHLPLPPLPIIPNTPVSPPPSLTLSLPPVHSPSPVSSKPSQDSTASSSIPSRLASATSTTKPPRPLPKQSAPYPVGFQPKGTWRNLTDEFLSLRKSSQEGSEEATLRRVERAKLDRRLEKLIVLHFPDESSPEEKREPIRRPNPENRRLSSFFDLRSIGNFSDASGLWREAVTSGFDGAKLDLRHAEQRITPWEEDAKVSKCPLCLASFHPLTNRKHHCRLCGRVVCALPIKSPQRPVPCSLLFVVDGQSRQVEEVNEGVDYGVKKRRVNAKDKGLQDDPEKFLRGQFIQLEGTIEETLPQFQELLVALNRDNAPSKEASLARKHLLDSFAQYEQLAKRIRTLPCTSGSSQDRVQLAIASRATQFLQKHMFPLRSLPTRRSEPAKDSRESPNRSDTSNSLLDIDAQLAQALQPLLEQEALLESFVEEAQSQRKFEDVKSLKVNLAEIRNEIERLLSQAR